MRKLVLAVLGCAIVLPAGEAIGQIDIYMDIANSRFLKAEKLGEQRVQSPADRTTKNLAPLCYTYYKLRRYNKLFPCITELESRIASGDSIHRDSIIVASDASALPHMLKAGAFLELGDPRRSLEEGERALALVKEEGGFGIMVGWLVSDAYYVELLPILGIAATLLGRKDDAARYIKQLENTSISRGGGLQRANLQNVGLATMHVAARNYERALFYLEKGERDSVGRALGDMFFGGGDSFATFYELPKLLMIGKCQLELGKIAEAKSALDQVIGHKHAEEYGDLFWVALFERGRVAERENRPAEAIEYYRRAIEVIERQRASLTTEATKIGFVGNKQVVYGRLIALLVAADRAAEAFDIVERSKARALVDMLAQKKDFAPRGADPEKTKRIFAELDSANAQALVVAPDQAAVTGQVRSVQAIRSEIQAAAPELASLVTVSTVVPEELRALLEADETLVEYYYDDSALLAFVLTRDAVRVATLEHVNLGELVGQFRRRLEEPESNAYRATARQLYDGLLAPLEPYLKGNNLAVVPHGALHYIPFAALQAPDDRPLIERFGLRVLPSASVIKFIRPALKDARGGLIAFGNPDLGDVKLDLSYAEAEARSLAAMYPESRLLVRGDASETNFKKAAGVFSRIHLATHGKFSAESPLDSGLLLAKDGENDGQLRVSELYSMDLDADLIVLSACETGLGKVDSGDDVVGLTRGFLYAGARSIVSSLWSVEDRATAELMKAFYEGLRGTGKREALRQAQLKTRAAFPHPFFWAPFQLVGRPE